MRRIPIPLIALVATASAFGWLSPCSRCWAEELPQKAAPTVVTGGSSQPWWKALGDAELTALVDRGLEANHDLLAARSQVVAAKARTTWALAPLLPTLSFDADVSGQPSASRGFQFGGISGGGGESLPAVLWSGSALFTVRYNFDLFGRHIKSLRATKADTAATSADADALAARVAYNIAEAYFDLVAARQQITLVEHQIKTSEALLKIVKLRFAQGGQEQAADALQQLQQLHAAKARLPEAQSVVLMAEAQMLVLLGAAPSATGIKSAVALPVLPPPPSQSATLEAHRPEIRAAQKRLGASEQRLSSARRKSLPTLSLSAQGGAQFYRGDELAGQGTWGVGLGLSIPIFQGLEDIGAVREARAAVEQRSLEVDQLKQAALIDVDRAQKVESQRRAQLKAHKAMLEAASLAYKVSRREYSAGLGNYQTLLLALSAFEQAELTVLQSHRSLISARLELYHSLGGPWTDGLALGQEQP